MAAVHGTIIVTGSDGCLGSEIVLAIARERPFVHFLLTVRDLNSSSASQLSDKLRMLGPRSYEIAKVDLADFVSVRSFAAHTVERITSRDIPPISVLIHCAAVSSFLVDPETVDGFDPSYQINCLSPFLLTVSLLSGFWLNGNTKIIHIGSTGIGKGRLDYFQQESVRTVGAPLGTAAGVLRYESSKLLMSASAYALRRSLRNTANISLTILTLDPGLISDRAGRCWKWRPFALGIARLVFICMGPLARTFSESAMNDATVAAKAVATVAFATKRVVQEKDQDYYFVLSEARDVEKMLPVSKDEHQMSNILKQTIKDTGLDTDLESMVSP